MLKVYFGDKANAIYNTSVYFNHSYKDEWLTENFAKEVISDIDKSEVISAQSIISPVLGNISPAHLSGGVKTLILMKHFPGKVFNASNCGDNCAKWILKLGEARDLTINLFHAMNFGKEAFDIRILNDKKLIVHNMEDFLKAAAKYLKEAAS